MTDEGTSPEASKESPPTPEGAPPGEPSVAPLHEEAALGEAALREAALGEAALEEAALGTESLGESAEPGETKPPIAETGRLPSSKPEPPVRPNYVFLAVVAIVSLALDLATKWWAKARLEDAKSFADRHIDVIPQMLKLTFAKNKGGAFGLLQGESEAIRQPFFLGISALAVVFIVSLYRRLTPQQTALKWGLPLVLGGALGNLLNRIQYNYVVDFIDVYVKRDGREHHWPTFNVADVAIVVGVGLMAIDMFTSRKPRTPHAPEVAPVSASSPPGSAEEARRAP